MCNKDGIHGVSARVYIDGPADGDVAAFARRHDKGERVRRGLPSHDYEHEVFEWDTEAIEGAYQECISSISPAIRGMRADGYRKPFSFCGFQDEFRRPRGEGELEIRRGGCFCSVSRRTVRGEYIMNTTRIIDHDAVNAAQQATRR